VDTTTRDAFADRLFESALGFLDVVTVYIGDRLGLYRTLADSGPLTPAELASITATDERYVREWLEQQAASGILRVRDPHDDPAARRYGISPEHAEALADPESLSCLAAFMRQMAGTTTMLPRLVDAFRSGAGIPYADYGADVIEGQADVNRPVFLQLLAREWLPAVPDVHARLSSGTPARVADIGCGGAWSCIAIAQAYRHAFVDGVDPDGASIELARSNVRAAGLDARITLHQRDAAELDISRPYDLVLSFESIHDLARPVDVLRTMRRLAADDGAVIIVDERTADTFAAPADATDRLFYGWSVLLCLPNGRTETPSAATGTVMRPATLDRYAREAGFSRSEVLPVEHPTFRLYRLWQ